MGARANNKMQQTRHGQNGASLLILVLATRHRLPCGERIAAIVLVSTLVPGCVHSFGSRGAAPADLTELVLKESLSADTQSRPGIVELSLRGTRRPRSAHLASLLPGWSFVHTDQPGSTHAHLTVDVSSSVEGLRQVQITSERMSTVNCHYTVTHDGEQWSILGRHCDTE